MLAAGVKHCYRVMRVARAGYRLTQMLDLFADAQFIYLSGAGDYLLVRAHDGAIRDKLKQLIPSVRRDKQTGDWKVPVSHDFIQKLRELRLPFTGDATKYSMQLKVKEKLLIEASAQSTGDLNLPGFNVELFPYQRAGVIYAKERKRTIIGDEMGLGKAQPHFAELPTPTGWRTMGDIQVGDMVFDEKGTPTEVEGKYPQGLKPIYRIEFTDGSSTFSCDEHLWNVRTPLQKWRKAEYKALELKEFMHRLKDEDGNSEYFIPIAEPLHYPRKDLQLHPYLIGALLGDGGMTATYAGFTSADEEMLLKMSSLLPDGMCLRKQSAYDHRIINTLGTAPNAVIRKLKDLQLMGCNSETKFIPWEYQQGSIDQRIDLLRGLMDTDGYISKDGYVVQFTSVSPQLMEGLKQLVCSLGGTAKISQKQPKKGKLAYTATICMPPAICPFSLSRKVARYVPRTKYLPRRAFKSVKFIGFFEASCIRVANPASLYLTNDCIVTHNTFQGLATVYALNAFPCLVVTPASNKYMWAETEIPRALPNHKVVLADKKTKLAELERADVIVTNYHQLAGFRTYTNSEGKSTRTCWTDLTKKEAVPSALTENLRLLRLKGIILDECHYIKELDTSWTKLLMTLRHGVPVRLPMSGTVFQNKPAELIAPLKFMDRLDEFGGQWHFLTHYCAAHQDEYGYNTSGSSNELELNQKLRASCYIRRLKKDVLTELPDKLRTTVLTDIDNRTEYVQAEKELIQWVQDRVERDHKWLETIKHLPYHEQQREIAARKWDKAERAEKGEVMVRISALKKVTSEGKLAAAKDWIKDFMASGEKLVIFATHQHVHEFLLKNFPNSARILSTDSPEERQRNVKRFQTDEDCQLLVGAMGTSAGNSPAGVGHTLTRASNVLFLELGWNPALHDQCEDRCHRIGQKDTVNCYYLLGRNTIDVKIAELIEDKRAVGRKVMDGNDVEMNDGILDDLVDWLSSKAA